MGTSHNVPCRESRSTHLFISDFDVRKGWVINATPRPLYPQGSAPEPVWKGMKKRKSLACTGARTPDLSFRSDSLYCLHCPHSNSTLTTQIFAPYLQHDALYRRHIHILQATLETELPHLPVTCDILLLQTINSQSHSFFPIT